MRRSAAVSSMVTCLLNYYDIVLYSDTDEIVVADPRKYAGLKDFFNSTILPYYTCIGLNLINHIYEENPYTSALPFLRQRTYCQFSSPMCKTLVTRRPIRWGGGFHSSDSVPNFSDLYLFHLRNADFGEALKRLALTRTLDWADPGAGLHQRQENRGLIDLFRAYADWQKVDNFDEIEAYKKQTFENVKLSESEKLYYVPLNVQPAKLYRIPDAFHDSF